MASKTLSIKKNILSANAEKADETRGLLDNSNILMINIMSSPGSGKTSLLMQTISHFKDKYGIAVIEGDVASSIDADKILSQSIPAVQINTGGGCHLDANMVRNAIEKFDLNKTDIIFIENVGNLVCTADFDLGSHKNAVILSIPEGDDKPRKYPTMFAEADIVLVNKIDVLPHFDFDIAAFPELITGFNPSADVLLVSTKTGEGMDKWFSWIEAGLKEKIKIH
ncbi:MAG: hydrogenase nickel incorporation protein HypB [Spirochaetes bacterium]|nr:hydrogenase nickel incorporation protein HypB [Spirochaetota bacterium]